MPHRARCLAGVLLCALHTAAAHGAGAQGVPRTSKVAAGDRARAAMRFDSIGLAAFAEYESVAHTARQWASKDASLIQAPRGAPLQFDPATIRLAEGGLESKPRNKLAQALREMAYIPKPVPGDASLTAAITAFENAWNADSTDGTVRRHLYRAYAAREDWTSLVAAGRRTARFAPTDAKAWLAVGLGLHRQERHEDAGAAFDRAVAAMPPAQQRDYLSVARLLAPRRYANALRYPDSLELATRAPDEQRALAARFWAANDPRPGTPINEARLEYAARLAYADFRWTRDETHRGIDSDRGDILVRFGHPEGIYGFGRTLIWIYPDNSVFFFGRVPGYLQTLISQTERRVVEDSILIEKSVGWTTMPIVRNSFPMLSRVARFRAGGDSVDAVVTAAVPVRNLVGDAELAGPLPIAVHLDVLDPALRTIGVEKRRVNVSRDSLPAAINGTWVRRLGTGAHVVRIGAEQADVGKFANASNDVTVDSLSGFGMSDILLGTEPTGRGTASPARWTDVRIAPTVGVFPYAQPLGLVWESYALDTAGGKVDYVVTLELERTFKHTLTGFTARIARNLMNVITQSGSATGRIAVSFPESRPANAIVTNVLTVDLNGSVPGPYRLTVEVKDAHTGRVARRTTAFVLTPD